MSRTNPNQTGLPNPAKRFYEWKGAAGKFSYYDKEKTEDVDAPENFTFILLDELNCITGYNKGLKKGIFSNEVRNLSQQKLFVKYFKGDDIAEGFYKEIKDKVTSKSVGGKFTKSVYMAFKGPDGKLQIGNIKFSGSGVDGWFGFTEKFKNVMYKGAIKLSGKRPEVNGNTDYFVPEFKLIDVAPETDNEAELLQQELSTYLKEYFERAGHVDVKSDSSFVTPPDTLFVPDDVVEEIKKEVKAEQKDRLADNEDGHIGDPDLLPF